jgi:hypothetical protein
MGTLILSWIVCRPKHRSCLRKHSSHDSWRKHHTEGMRFFKKIFDSTFSPSLHQASRKCARDRANLHRRIFASKNIYHSGQMDPRHGQHALERDIASRANRPVQLLLRLHAVQIRSSGATTAFKNKPARSL